ncbi:MAG: transcription termination factor NusG domain protein [Nitrospirales bacterium]|nr:MAG: transcription termination factor NusG domain protein [Nitrospirales bacterium]
MFEEHAQNEKSICWYALRTKSRHEKMVRERLVRKGVEALLPTVKRMSRWKDRKKEIEHPLFPGYCFVRFSLDEKLQVLNIIGVVNIVGCGHRPEVIPNEEISSLKVVMTSFLQYDPHPYLKEGMNVEVVDGVLKGVRGILLQKSEGHRLAVGVRLIQQALAVDVNAMDVMPL